MGYFEVTHDITKYTKACIFSHIGKRTNLAVRFSTVGGESGSADTVRFVKILLTSQETNIDQNNIDSIYFSKDAIKFVRWRKINQVWVTFYDANYRDCNSKL